MLNKAILMGRLTRDPELRHTQSNMAVCSFRLAIDRDRKGPNGERQTDFIDCVAWGRQAEFVAQWFAQGIMAIVIGRIQSRQWQDQNGNKRTAIEIHCSEISFGETKKAREGNSGCTDGQGAYRPQATAPPQPVAPAFDLPPDGTGYEDVLPCDDNDVPF